MVYPLKPGSVIHHLVKKGRKYSRIYVSVKKMVKKRGKQAELEFTG
jgi:hypothetical protein